MPSELNLDFPTPDRRTVSGQEIHWHGSRIKGKRRKAKDQLHLLFVVSRPEGAGFIDPRADPQAVLDALDCYAPGRFTIEFLRPATFDRLVKRLDDADLPKVDVLHFDGHGFFDRKGMVAAGDRRIGGTDHRVRRADGETDAVTGDLPFEKADGQIDFVSAAELGQQLNERDVPLVIRSACQSAM